MSLLNYLKITEISGRNGFVWISRGMLEIVIQEVLWSIRGSYSAIWSLFLTNVKWHSDPWPVTVISQPIRLSTKFMNLISSLIFTEIRVVSMGHLQRCSMPAGNACPSGHLVPSPFLGLTYASVVETSFLELAVLFHDFSPWIPLGTVSIFKHIGPLNTSPYDKR